MPRHWKGWSIKPLFNVSRKKCRTSFWFVFTAEISAVDYKVNRTVYILFYCLVLYSFIVLFWPSDWSSRQLMDSRTPSPGRARKSPGSQVSPDYVGFFSDQHAAWSTLSETGRICHSALETRLSLYSCEARRCGATGPGTRRDATTGRCLQQPGTVRAIKLIVLAVSHQTDSRVLADCCCTETALRCTAGLRRRVDILTLPFRMLSFFAVHITCIWVSSVLAWASVLLSLESVERERCTDEQIWTIVQFKLHSSEINFALLYNTKTIWRPSSQLNRVAAAAGEQNSQMVQSWEIRNRKILQKLKRIRVRNYLTEEQFLCGEIKKSNPVSGISMWG